MAWDSLRCRVFRDHYHELVSSIQDPDSLADHLFSRHLLGPGMMHELQADGLSQWKKSRKILLAVQDQVAVHPGMFDTFVEALRSSDPSSGYLADKLLQACDATHPPPPREQSVGNVTAMLRRLKIRKQTAVGSPAGTVNSRWTSVVTPEPQSSIVKQLLSYKMTLDEEEKWSERAVESLMKKLKTDDLQELEKAITTNGRTPTSCVTIPQTRQQISPREVLPHVMYCRLWRWPDLQSNLELKAVDTCQFAFNLQRDDVCINPFHYVRVQTPILPPVFVPIEAYYDSILEPLSPLAKDTRVPDNVTLPVLDPPSPPVFPASFPSSTGALHPAFPSSSFPHSNPPPKTPLPLRHTHDVTRNGTVDSLAGTVNNIGPPALSTSSINPGPVPPPTLEKSIHPGYKLVEYIEPPYWCSVIYYELKNRVGERFDATKSSLTVDGFTDPSSADRFCLGLFSSIHRDAVIERTRAHIGHGVRLIYVGGDVYAECLSENSIFVESVTYNKCHNWHSRTVCKVPPRCTMCIFSIQFFAHQLAQSVNQGFEEVFKLLRMCTIRISFVKGWGADYNRHCVTLTPCWVEVHLNGPLMWVDKVLSQISMRPTMDISSMS